METVETHGNTVKKCIDPAAQQPSSRAAQQIASELLGEEREPNAHERQHAELNALP